MRALLSVDDKTGLIALARGLQELGWELIATDGTRAALAAEGVTARSVEDVTGSPSLLDGRVKTLHPKIHAALLARRSNAAHVRELAEQQIEPIDLVAANLYPFREAMASGVSGDALLEKIDIGGVTLLRSASKNYNDVLVLCRPDRYGPRPFMRSQSGIRTPAIARSTTLRPSMNPTSRRCDSVGPGESGVGALFSCGPDALRPGASGDV
ncbi:MAG: hypothetical protein NVS1B1_03340 [Candidatus Limnocylindrales bacterium]